MFLVVVLALFKESTSLHSLVLSVQVRSVSSVLDSRESNLLCPSADEQGENFPTFISGYALILLGAAFQNISQIIDELQAHRVFALPNGYNPELIKQFYSTLYVSGHPYQPATWKFDYMIQGQAFHLTGD